MTRIAVRNFVVFYKSIIASIDEIYPVIVACTAIITIIRYCGIFYRKPRSAICRYSIIRFFGSTI